MGYYPEVGSAGCKKHCSSFISKFKNEKNDNHGIVCCYGDQETLNETTKNTLP